MGNILIIDFAEWRLPELIAFGSLIVGIIAAWLAWRQFRHSKTDTKPPQTSSTTQTAQDNHSANQFGTVTGSVTVNQGGSSGIEKEILDRLTSAHRENYDKELEIKQLREAIAALTEQQGPKAEDALAALKRGETNAAEKIFLDVLNTKKAEGAAANKEAAAAARHLGAIAFASDTTKALNAYQQSVGLDPEEPDGWNMLGHLLLRLGKLDDAQSSYLRVLSLGNSLADQDAESVAYGNLGLLAYTRGDLDQAEEYFYRSLSIDQKNEKGTGIANSKGQLGLISAARGDFNKAKEFLLEAVEIRHEKNDEVGLANDYGNIGTLYQRQNDLENAEKYILKASDLHRKLGRLQGIAQDLVNLGIIHQRRGELEKAEEHYLEALSINEKLGRKEGMAKAYSNLGILYSIYGDREKAEDYLLKSLNLHTEIGRKEGMANQFANLGRLHLERGAQASGRSHINKAAKLYDEIAMKLSAERMRQWLSGLSDDNS